MELKCKENNLRQFLGEKFYHGHLTDIDWNKPYHDHYVYFVTEDDNAVRTTGARDKKGALLWTVVAASEFDDGFCSNIFAEKIDGFWVAQMDLDDYDEVKWASKMYEHGWEPIPESYYDMEVKAL